MSEQHHEQQEQGRRRLVVEEIVSLYADGLSIREIADRDGRSTTSIHRILTGNGVRMRPRGQAPIPLPRRAAILAAYLDGDPLAEICERFGVSSYTVRNIAEEKDEELRPRGGQRRLDVGTVDRLAGQGWTAPAIAMMTRFSEGHVRRVMRELGHGRRPYGRGRRGGRTAAAVAA